MFKYICTTKFNERSWGLRIKINLLLVDNVARSKIRAEHSNQKQPPPITRDKHPMSSPSHQWTWPARTLLLLRYLRRLGLGTDEQSGCASPEKGFFIGGKFIKSYTVIRSRKEGWMIRFWEIDCNKYVDSVSSVPWFRDSRKIIYP